MDASIVPHADPVIGNRVVCSVRTPTPEAMRMGPCVIRAGLFASEESFHFGVMSYGGMLLAHIVNSWVQVESGGKRYKARTGQFGMVNSLDPHTYIGGEDLRVEWLEVVGSTVSSFLNRLAPHGVAIFPLAWSEGAEGDFNNILQLVLHGKGTESEVSRSVSDLLYSFTSQQEHQDKNDEEAIHFAIDDICQHFRENLSIDEMAESAGMGKFRFIRSFETVTGMTPYAYLLRTRIEQAKWVLTNSSSKINDVGVSCGFKNNTSFGVAFKKETGFTPGQWRADHQFVGIEV